PLASIGESCYPAQVMFEMCHFDPEAGPWYEYVPLSNVKMVSAGYWHSVALLEDGSCWTWGEDIWDQCGMGPTAALGYVFPVGPVRTYVYNPYTQRNEPLTDVKYIRAGGYFTIAIREDDSVWAWGDSYTGGLGHPFGDGYAHPSEFDNPLMVDTAIGYAIGVKKDGTLWFWGNNNYQVGIPFFGSLPVQIPNLSGIINASAANSGDWADGGLGHVVCLKSDGTVWAFGMNWYGQLGIGRNTDWYETTPQQVVGENGVGFLNLFCLTVYPNPFEFPVTQTGKRSFMIFKVKNLTARPITLGKIYLQGENKSEFCIINDYASLKEMKPGELRTFQIIFIPGRTGKKNIKVIVPFENKKREVYISGECGAVENKVIIKGKVYDKNTGTPIENANVLIGNYGTASDPNGYYIIDWASPGVYSYVISKDGYVSLRGTIELTPNTIIEKDFCLSPSESGDEISIVEVNAKYNPPWCFLGNIHFLVEFSVVVDWKSYTPYKAIFTTTKSKKEYIWESSSFDDYLPKIALDVGELEPGDTLRVKAISGEGKESSPGEFRFIIMKSIPGSFNVVDTGSGFYYQSLSVGNFSFISEGVPSNLIPAEIPFFGGSSFNLLFVPDLKAEVKNNTAEYSLLFGDLINGGNIGPVQINFSPYLGLSGTYSSYLMNWKWSGFIGLKTDIKVETPPFYLPIPIPIPVYAKGAFLLSLNTRLDIKEIQPIKLNGTFVIEPAVRGILGVGVSDVLAVEGWVQGGSEITVQYPETPNLKNVVIVVKAGYTIYFLVG
ncbi:MAG: carboxypeptidase regulatory-like domain-containing protein, partial [Candidatus Omnitrophica bacterium]|nr:carboxypeptidase regulatory-like domain-containing protein [Candidatus Omnitrophota bacterium]